MRPTRTAILVVVSLACLAPSGLRAEPAARRGGGRTGLQLLYATGDAVFAGRDHRIRGTAYEVLGLARLAPLADARVRARCGGAWVGVAAGPGGRFVLDVPVPVRPRFGDEGPRIEVEVSEGDDARTFETAVQVRSPVAARVRTDRNLYRPGETVHLWVRAWDVRTGRPLAGLPVRVGRSSGGGASSAETSQAGVVALDYEIPERAGPGSDSLSVQVGEGEAEVGLSASYRIGERPTTDLFVTVATEPETAAPGETVEVRVEVRTASGFPVQGASVELEAGSALRSATTDAAGLARLAVQAPEYQASARGRVALSGTVRHSGHGAADLSGGFAIEPPTTLEVELIPLRGGVLPEVRDEAILSVFGEAGGRPASGTTVEVRGAAIPGGVATAVVDRHGFVAIPVQADRGAYARHVDGAPCAPEVAATVEVTVRSEVPQVTRLCLPVDDEALVAPDLDRPAVAPGEAIDVSILRRPSAASRPVVVELLAGAGEALELVETVVAAPSTRRVRLTAPRDRTGLFLVRARPVNDEGRTERGGLAEALLVRPALPSFPELEVAEDVYPIRGEAEVTMRTPAGAPASHVALLVRDLAQHQGETPFQEQFLGGALERAVLDPSTPEARLLVRTALEAHASLPGGFGVQSDPNELAQEILDQRLGPWLFAVERLLATALDAGTVDEVTVGEGRARTFRPEALDLALESGVDVEGDGGAAETLGGAPITVEMLTEADPSFTFEAAARRVARGRLVRLLGLVAHYFDPEGDDVSRPRGRADEAPERWLSELVRLGAIQPSDLLDPWGGTFALRRTGRSALFTVAVEAEGYELASPGPDGRLGTADDVRDPFARVVPEGTPYARASGEDLLMARLAALAPGAAALDDLLAAYERLTDEALEEMVGDLMLAGIGYGGAGVGYGRGSGGLRGHRASVPSIRTGAASVMGAALAGVVREDFPATLFFTGEAEVDPSGRTVFAIPLADAPTTYIVEALLWREDGWTWSASTTIRVDQDLLVDAPVPRAVTVGDEVVLPVRLANRTKTARTLRVRLAGDGSLGIAARESELVEVPAEDAIEVPMTLRLEEVSEGRVTITALTRAGEVLDAVRRPMAVRTAMRRASAEVAEVVLDGGGLDLAVPEGAVPLGRTEVSVAVGAAVFGRGDHPSWGRWARALTGPAEEAGPALSDWEVRQLELADAPVTVAQLLSADWGCRGLPDSTMGLAIEALADHVEGLEETTSVDGVRYLARLLLLLAPAVAHAAERPALAPALGRLARALRQRLESGAALFADAPWLSARAAAALLWTAPESSPGTRALELLGRARAAVVEVGDDRWVEGGRDDEGDELFAASSLLALAEARLGDRDAAFGLLRSMARLLDSTSGDVPEVQGLRAEDRVVAAAAAEALGRVEGAVAVSVDGVPTRVALASGVGDIDVVALGAGGEHRVELHGRVQGLVRLRALSEHGVDWSTPPPMVGPFSVAIEGEPGSLDRRSGLRLVVRNRVPRLIRSATVVISLPAGVEVDEVARGRMATRSSGAPQVSAETLSLTLGPFRPRAAVEVPLPWIWTTAGRLRGLGVVAAASDRPDALSVAPARVVEVPAGGEGSEVRR